MYIYLYTYIFRIFLKSALVSDRKTPVLHFFLYILGKMNIIYPLYKYNIINIYVIYGINVYIMYIIFMYIYVIQAVRHFFLNELYQQTNLL